MVSRSAVAGKPALSSIGSAFGGGNRPAENGPPIISKRVSAAECHLQLLPPLQLPWPPSLTNHRADVAPKPPFSLKFRILFPNIADFFSPKPWPCSAMPKPTADGRRLGRSTMRGRDNMFPVTVLQCQ